jgi:HEAT repeat protein
LRDWLKEFDARHAQPLVVFTHHPLQVDSLVPADAGVPVLLDAAATMSATYGVAFQLQFREESLVWSARPATLIIDRAGVLRHADDYEDRNPARTPLQVLDDLQEQRQLIAALPQADERFANAARLALAAVGPQTKSIVPVLTAALRDERTDVRAGAAAALYWIAICAEDAIPALAGSLDDRDPRTRRLAAAALGRIGAAAEPILVKALKHEDAMVRQTAAWDLSRAGAPGPGALQALIGAYSDSSTQVRLAVVRSLVRLPLPLRAQQEVLDALATALTDQAESIRHDAAYGLTGMGWRAVAAMPAVAKALRHPDKEARRWAAIVSQAFGTNARDAIPELLINAIEDTGNSQGTAFRALEAIGPDATSALLTLLKRGSDKQRHGAAAVLGKIHPDDQRVIPGLIEALSDPAPRVRAGAAAALGEYGARASAAVDTLIQRLRDEDGPMRLEAARALKRIDAKAASGAGVP